LAPGQPKRLITYAVIGGCNWTQRWYRPGGEWTPEVVADEVSRIGESGYLRRDGESCNEVLLREVQALWRNVERIETLLRLRPRLTPRRRGQATASREPRQS
jgi:hypothetical protein